MLLEDKRVSAHKQSFLRQAGITGNYRLLIVRGKRRPAALGHLASSHLTCWDVQFLVIYHTQTACWATAPPNWTVKAKRPMVKQLGVQPYRDSGLFINLEQGLLTWNSLLLSTIFCTVISRRANEARKPRLRIRLTWLNFKNT